MPRPGEPVAGLTTTLGPYQIPTARMAVAHSLTWSTSEMHSVATSGADGAPAGRQPIAAGAWIAALLARGPGTVVIADECSATDGRPLLSCTRTYEYPWPADA